MAKNDLHTLQGCVRRLLITITHTLSHTHIHMSHVSKTCEEDSDKDRKWLLSNDLWTMLFKSSVVVRRRAICFEKSSHASLKGKGKDRMKREKSSSSKSPHLGLHRSCRVSTHMATLTTATAADFLERRHLAHSQINAFHASEIELPIYFDGCWCLLA